MKRHILITLTTVCWLAACQSHLCAADILRPANTILVYNEAATGTTVNKLVKLTGAPSTGIVTTAGDTGGAVGVCVSGCGVAAASTTASIVAWGNVSCVFDGATTAGNYVGISATVAGDCTDAGALYPSGGQVLGSVSSTNAGAGTYPIVLWRVPGGASGSLYFSAISSAVSSVLFKGASRFLHNYAHATANGYNTFLGVNAGNFTMSPAGGAATLASYNTGIGADVLSANTKGSNNSVGGGYGALLSNTEGSYNSVGGGVYALYANSTGNYNSVGAGYRALYASSIASFNSVGAGGFALNLATGSYNSVGGGYGALLSTAGGSGNTANGYLAGYTDIPANGNVSGSFNTWEGMESGPGSAAQIDNTCALGYRAKPVDSNTCVIGNPSVTDVYLGGVGGAARPQGAPGGGIPAWGKYALLKIANGVNGCANANGCWQVNGVLGAAAAAALTQDVALVAMAARGHVTDYRIKVGVRCTGATTALTGLGTTASNVLYRVVNYNIDQVVADTAIATGPPTAGGSNTHAATSVVASLTTTVQNVDQLVVGCAVDYWLLWGVLP